MSEYYLADRRAAERTNQRDTGDSQPSQAQDIKVKLLGDFLLASEPAGCDPYNSTQGKSLPDAWSIRRARR